MKLRQLVSTLDRDDRALVDYLTHLEQASIVKTLDNLMTFPWIHALVQSQRLQLHAAYFDVATGLLSVRDPDVGAFASSVRCARMQSPDRPDQAANLFELTRR